MSSNTNGKYEPLLEFVGKNLPSLQKPHTVVSVNALSPEEKWELAQKMKREQKSKP